MSSLNRRQAVKAIAVSGVAVMSAPALADTDPDARLVQLEADYLTALKAACDASSRDDEYDAPADIKSGPRIQIGGDKETPRYAYSDEEVERAIEGWLAAAGESEKRNAEQDEMVRKLVERAKAWATENRGHEFLSPDEQRTRALAYRPAWEQIKKAHAEAIAQTDLPRLRAEHTAAWDRVREIEEKYVSTPALGPTGYAVKARLMHRELSDFDYSEEGLTGRLLASLMRDLAADPLPVI